ncbi:PREDICTED: uncharacterized protein LOC104768216 [Camelina sativa]|uniref:Uncharacterized protein LOC104768216 n=1 Tax=Camelina sativa TaxID=90675 RepID=A0ABM0XSM6_CAMSA|nr:PREDICTED: uncharacterized protein LOC104768216 [Camelina sativa]
MDMLKEHFAPENVDLIGAIPLGSCRPQDSLGWHFTKSGKYTVKSGYDTERFAASRLSTVSRSGPEITPLLAGDWGAHCPPKIKHFMWQVPVGPDSFPTESVYANVDHFLGSTNPVSQITVFPWLMWYIWKAQNARVFEDVMDNPLDVVQLEEGEANAWLQAQVEVEDEDSPNLSLVPNSRQRGSTSSLPNLFTGYRCFVDVSWKATDALAGAGWVCSSFQDSRSNMGATNFRRSLSPLHAEVEAFIWAMRCMIGHDYRDVAFYTDCSDLVKMVSSPHDWPAFTPYLDDIKIDQAEFSSFSLSHVPRNANVSADYLASQARLSPQHVLFVNNLPPNWLF